MSHNQIRGRLALAVVWATALALLMSFVSLGSAGASAVTPSSTSPAWTGTFDNFHSSGWNSSWGLTSDTAQCAIATGTYNCNWGYANLQPVSDPTSPSGQALKVTYPASSGPPSCYQGGNGCVLGGGQFYQDLTSNGQTALHNSPTIDLKYYYNFPVGFDFGKKTAGKMPGLYGGVPGCESGGQHCQNGWSTRYMWRGGSASAPSGELYFYGGGGSGYGQGICLGNWTFPADGKWHSIEQSVNITTGAITVWSDGKSVCQTTQTLSSPVSGVFFSTFHGGHDTSWSPTKTTTSEFADFSLATAGPQTPGGGSTPATPTSLAVTGSTGSSISLGWAEQNNSDPAVSYKVYEGNTVVATPTTTSTTITGLAPGSSHTYTVTALDSAGTESGHSTAASGATSGGGGGGGGATVTIAKTKDWGSGFTDTGTVTNTSASAINGWNVQFDLDASENIESASNVTYTSSGNHYTLTNTSSDATIAPGASQTFVFSGDYATGYIAPTNVTVNGQGSGGGTPAVPSGLAATGSTGSSIGLTWTETDNSDPAASYKIYEGNTVVATPTTTSATITGLAPGSSHTYTVTALDSAGAESAHSAPVTASTTGTGPGSSFSQTEIDSAVAAPLFAWAAPTSSVPRPGTGPVNIGESKVVYYLALVNKVAPGTKSSNGTTVDSALLAQVRSMISGGKEPDADGGLEMWGQAPVAQALLLLRNGPAWSELTTAEQSKVTLLEAAMGYGSNYTYNDANSFSSGICGQGNFSKTNNPNYRDGGVDTEIAAIQFFGASTWDSMLSNFDDATVASQLNAAGLTNAGGCFTSVGSGANSAIGKPFVYQGHHSSDLMGLWSVLAGDTFDKTAQSTVGAGHIADGTTSPYDGQCCMGHEFNSTDSQGLRTSALYVFEGWMNVTGSRVTMAVLGNFDIANATTEAQYHIGTLDLKYKLDHGYISHALNQSNILVDDHGNPSTDGPNVKGFLYDWDAYSVAGAPQS